MSERHFNTILNREPEETLGEQNFTALADSIRLAEAQAGTGDGEATVSDALEGYSVSCYDGPDGLVTMHISWLEGEDFVTMTIRNDHGPRRDQRAGDRMKLSKIGRVLDVRTVSEQDLIEHLALIDKCAGRGGFRAKKLRPRILLAA